MKHIHCPVNAWDCPYFTDRYHSCRCTMEDPFDCDDFVFHWEESDPDDYYDDDWELSEKDIQLATQVLLQYEEKAKAWVEVVEVLKDYCTKYNPITIYDGNKKVVLKASDFDSSSILGVIEI